MNLVLLALAVLVAGALAAWRWPRAGQYASVVAGAIGLVPAVGILVGGTAQRFDLAWHVPYGSIALEIDALSALFLVAVFGLSAVAAVYGGAYLAGMHASTHGADAARNPHPLPQWRDRPLPRGGEAEGNDRRGAGVRQQRARLGSAWFFYNLLVAAMVVVVTARNGVLFLVAWELMALASYFLVVFDDEPPAVRDAGWTYLVASHLGTAFLLGLFILLGREGRSLDFESFVVPASATGALFLLAVIGFGTKAGFMPLHVWLPEAHPAAPSHVSAVMSGVMIKMGIYGLLRTLTWLGPPPAWWGWVLVGIGVSSGVLGVLLALAQHDLKRVLAYSSVENVGIIALGIGAGLLGRTHELPALAVLGFGGALWHVLNHAAFKGLLFLGAGAVAHATGTRALDQLGGLGKRMPCTATAFLVGAVAICGLPPLNGFVGEFLIYVGALQGIVTDGAALVVPLAAVLGALALIGGLAAATFAKAFGVTFLGAPRSEPAGAAHESGPAMLAAVGVLALGCVGAGLVAPVLVRALAPAIGVLAELEPGEVGARLGGATAALGIVTAVGGGLIVLIVALAVLRRWLLAGGIAPATVTWDCGYAQPTARMQYTGSSFAQPLTELFAPVLRTRRTDARRLGTSAAAAPLFPGLGALATETPDPARAGLFEPAFRGLGWGLARLRWLQHGNVHLYVLYIALTLVVLLVWKLG